VADSTLGPVGRRAASFSEGVRDELLPQGEYDAAGDHDRTDS
jgi:hypothetical protein